MLRFEHKPELNLPCIRLIRNGLGRPSQIHSNGYVVML
jgi:hypothetical protein